MHTTLLALGRRVASGYQHSLATWTSVFQILTFYTSQLFSIVTQVNDLSFEDKPKSRLDKLLTERNLCRSRAQAQQLISEGLVAVKQGDQWSFISKANSLVQRDVAIKISDHPLQHYVSRAALKLKGAITRHPVNLAGYRALDIGQSTGGFTQVLLESGVATVVGIEVGHGQLAPQFRDHPKVICYEGCNARHLTSILAEKRSTKVKPDLKTTVGSQAKQDQPNHHFDVAVMDVSFISQTLIIPELKNVLRSGSIIFSLVKPQFEARPGSRKKGGIIRDETIWFEVENKIKRCFEENHFTVHDYFPSSMTGSDGNREYFLFAQLSGSE